MTKLGLLVSRNSQAIPFPTNDPYWLGEPVARERLACVERHREGAHHRAAGGGGQVFSPAAKKDLEDRWRRVQKLVTHRQ